jgi:hypothetical protein
MIRRFWRVAQLVEQRTVNPPVVGSNPTTPAITRRQVLAGLLAAPVVKYFLPPVGGWRPWEFRTESFIYKTTERYSTGFTDWRGIYGTAGDGVALRSAAHPMSAAAFRAALLPGLNKIFSEEYDKHSDEWEEIFGPQQLTLFDSINPDSLEEIEIGLQPPADASGRISLLPETQRVAIAAPTGERPSDRERSGGILLPRLFGLRKENSR